MSTKHKDMLLDSIQMSIGDILDNPKELGKVADACVSKRLSELSAGSVPIVTEGISIGEILIVGLGGLAVYKGSAQRAEIRKLREKQELLNNVGKWGLAGISLLVLGAALYKGLKKKGKNKVDAARLTKKALVKAKAGASRSKNPEKAASQADKGIAKMDKIIAREKNKN